MLPEPLIKSCTETCFASSLPPQKPFLSFFQVSKTEQFGREIGIGWYGYVVCMSIICMYVYILISKGRWVRSLAGRSKGPHEKG